MAWSYRNDRADSAFRVESFPDEAAADAAADTAVATALTALLAGLPTEDPAIEGAVWNNNGVLTASAGP